MTDFNQRIVKEFRAKDGRVGGMFAKLPLLLLHHKGAKTGTDRISPLAYRELDQGWAVFASKAGADTNPAWFHNLMANPRTRIEVGAETVDVQARIAGGAEYDEIWEAQKSDFPAFADYERKTSRDHIPVVVLERA